jgi:hypothetical protein
VLFKCYCQQARHHKLTSGCDVPQIKDGVLCDDSVVADILTELTEENAIPDEKQLKADIALCATKSK